MEKPTIIRELLYKKGIPFCKRLFLKVKYIIENCKKPIQIIDHILINGLEGNQVTSKKPTNIEEIAIAIRLMERDNNVTLKAKLSFVFVETQMYIAERQRIINKFVVELLIPNNFNVKARNNEKTLSHKRVIWFENFMFTILRYVYILQKIVKRCLKNNDGMRYS